MKKTLTKKVVRKSPTSSTLRQLFTLSGNQCANPRCSTVLLSAEGTLVGEVALIAAESPGGPRFDISLSEADRRGFQNLLLLCCTCHTLVDRESKKYTEATLRKWKHDREARFKAVGNLLRNSYLDHITDDASAVELTLPKTVAGYSKYLLDCGGSFSVDVDCVRKLADYSEKIRHLPILDRQLMVAIIEKALELDSAGESHTGISIHPDDLKTLRIDNHRLSDYRIKKFSDALERRGLGFLDIDHRNVELRILSIHMDLGWSELAAYLETKNASLADLLIELNFELLD